MPYIRINGVLVKRPTRSSFRLYEEDHCACRRPARELADAVDSVDQRARIEELLRLHPITIRAPALQEPGKTSYEYVVHCPAGTNHIHVSTNGYPRQPRSCNDTE